MQRRVLRPGDAARRFSAGLAIDRIGIDDAMPPCLVDRPRGTGDWLLMHFHTAVTVHHDGALRSFPAQTAFVWAPGSRHTFGDVRRPWSHSWIHCAGAVVEDALRRSSLPIGAPIALPDAHALARPLEHLFDELTAFAAPDPEIMEAYVRVLVRSLDRAADPARHPLRIPARIVAALRHLERHLDRPLTLAELARQAGLSPSRFSAEFRRHLGASPIAHLLRSRLQRAAHLLRDRNLSVADVAARVGFADPFYFSRMFRRAYGASPLQHRRRLERA